jgi:protein FrlC
MSFRLAIVSGLLRYYPLDLALARIRAAGYDGVELWGGQFHGYALDLARRDGEQLVLDRPRAEAIRDMIAASGLELVCVTPEQLIYPINILVDQVPPFDGEQLRNRSRRLLELSIESAAALGCSRVVIITPMWHWRQVDGHYVRVSQREVVDTAIEEIASLCRHAEAHGVTLLFEPLVHHDTNGIETLDDVTLLFERVRSPNLQLMLDMGHVAVTANRLGIAPVAYFREHLERFGDKVTHIHVDDNEGKIDSHLAPGAGTVDLAGMTAELVRHGYSGWLSAELGILGEYSMPEHAEALLEETHRYMSQLIAARQPQADA